ncbi:hypothetical protein [uncultured Draconibacterium sp.]|uniref:GTP pyrophosphokinase n=1 Tax=uncultured Draconibacterium sp. TaxID=1573823 RepID=UPI002AA657E2|nr:hypothetical protein [uncultured Draconibacterium sp.]
MGKKLTEQEIKIEYAELKPTLVKLNSELIKQIETLLEVGNINLGFPIRGRIKELDSLADKQIRGAFTIRKTIKEVQDLVGIRIILLFSRDIDKVRDILKNNLEVIKEYNTMDRLDEDQFGYSSIHSVVRVPKSWLGVPMFSDFGDLITEIQIRTLSQHTWAETSHLIDYKNKDEIPRNVKRSISRLSALLETVDLEFERLLIESKEFKMKLKVDEEFNSISLERILDAHIYPENKRGNENYISLLESLEEMKMVKPQELISFIDEYKEEAKLLEKRVCQAIIDSPEGHEFVEVDGIKYTTKDKSKIKEGATYYNQVGLLALMFKIKMNKL